MVRDILMAVGVVLSPFAAIAMIALMLWWGRFMFTYLGLI